MGVIRDEVLNPLAEYMDRHLPVTLGAARDGPHHAWSLQGAAECLADLLTDSVPYLEHEAMRHVNQLTDAWRAFALEERERLLLLTTEAARTAKIHADDLSKTIAEERRTAKLAAERRRDTNRKNRLKATPKLTPQQVADYIKSHPGVKTKVLVIDLQEQHGVDRSTVLRNLSDARKDNLVARPPSKH
ncbi:MAG TPA: hypothetical protein PKC59_00870 [Burkholderiaceae bacterium]|nr:hypothetical protein [Burkholderiaceae bacterium]HMX09442.1 hypothetical protein [Burkholderiaceae bacterium]HMY99066.1 hypothetical protein [Burkholderiaceae bacterium]HNB43378.1 hypothetical protein [Burkholderiaceae bacterium]HNG77926.1 hypothetical protein [Burkholderiaceae bacterium]